MTCLMFDLALTCGCYEDMYLWDSPRIMQTVEGVNLSVDTKVPLLSLWLEVAISPDGGVIRPHVDLARRTGLSSGVQQDKGWTSLPTPVQFVCTTAAAALGAFLRLSFLEHEVLAGIGRPCCPLVRGSGTHASAVGAGCIYPGTDHAVRSTAGGRQHQRVLRPG